MAAFMSTYATQLNWGASYLVSDFYRRFLKAGASEEHYVMMSRVATVLLVIVSALVSMQLSSIRSGWEFVLEAGAGTGGVYLLRWYWWRINAWSEISAMATALLSSVALRWWSPFAGNQPVVFAKTALTTTAITTIVWVMVTLATSPEPEDVLVAFYRKVRPHVSGWTSIARLAPEIAPTRDLGRNLLAWILGCAMVYSALFGGGWLLLGPRWKGLLFVAIAAACGTALYNEQKNRGIDETA
jgi:Na+/proline symporter